MTRRRADRGARTVALFLTGVILVPSFGATARAATPCETADPESLLGSPYRTPAEVHARLECLETHLVAGGDRRAVFATVYVVTTRRVLQALAAGRFRNPRWASEYVVAFANLYRDALWRYERGELDLVPAAWRVAFDTARAGTMSVLQDAFLGINAHVNRDLAHAVVAAGIGEKRALRRADHDLLNRILVSATRAVQRRLAARYSPALLRIDDGYEPVVGALSRMGWSVLRGRAWDYAVEIEDAASDASLVRVLAQIERRASYLARSERRLSRERPDQIARLRELEGTGPGSAFCELYPCR